MYDFPKVPLGIGQQLDQGFKLARYTYPAAFGVIVLIAIIGVLAALSGAGLDVENTDDPTAIPASFWVGIIIFGVLNAYLYILLVIQVSFAAFGKGDMLDAMSFTLRKFIPLIVMYILYFLALTIGMILLLIPGFILAVSLSLCFYIMALEDAGPVESLKRSHSLIWGGNWWRATIVYTVGTLIVFGFMFLVGIVVGLLGTDLETGQTSMWADILFALLQPLIQPLLFCFGLVVYNDVRIRKEGGDLEDQINNL